MREIVFMLFAVVFGLSACSTTETISQAGKTDSESTQLLRDSSNQPQIQDNSDLSAKLVKENAELSASLEDAKHQIIGLQDQVQSLSARLEQQKTASAPVAGVASAAEIDLDVYSTGVSDTASAQAADAMKLKGFHPNYPALPKTMTMSRATTVYYYDNNYIPAAGVLAQDLANILSRKVITRRGASSFAKNKIIVHMRGK